jgi:glycosyltransferase involved in cell wall biosynthesis
MVKNNNINIKVSIIIPTYNSSKTLADCLASISQQTYRSFEVLIIDGLSNDNTVSIVKTYADKIHHLVVVSEKDKGIYDAMNKGIDLAKGEWLFFLGSDDSLYDGNVLQKIFQKNQALVEKSDFIYGNVKWGNSGEIYAGQFDTFRIYKQNICHQSIFYKKEIFQKLGKYELRYPIYADWHLNCWCYLTDSIRINYVEEIITNYSLMGTSSSTTDLFEKEKKAFFLKQKQYIKFNNKCQVILTMLPKGGFINDTRFYITKYLFDFLKIFTKK